MGIILNVLVKPAFTCRIPNFVVLDEIKQRPMSQFDIQIMALLHIGQVVLNICIATDCNIFPTFTE